MVQPRSLARALGAKNRVSYQLDVLGNVARYISYDLTKVILVKVLVRPEGDIFDASRVL